MNHQKSSGKDTFLRKRCTKQKETSRKIQKDSYLKVLRN
jgi:hypothetical protein